MEYFRICSIIIHIVMEFYMYITGTRRSLRLILLVLLVLVIPVKNIISQETTNFNEFYKFPFSIGVDYVGLSPFADYGFDVTITEVSGNIRYPLPSMPQLPPANGSTWCNTVY